MANLTLIDQWKCLDVRCSHRWETTVTYTELQGANLSGAAPADGDEVR
jgi:hypothetical protein